MKKELDDKIFKEFPQFFKTKGDLQRSLMDFGFDHGDGWFEIVYNLIKDISLFLLPEEELEIQQVKSKYGTLRFYSCPSLIKEYSWRLWFIPYCLYRLRNSLQKLADNIRHNIFHHYTRMEQFYNLVIEAERKTSITCEECGKPGHLVYIHIWYYTVCEEHEKELLNDKSYS